jgi:hypothetical protein
MARDRGSFSERLRRISLAQWGLYCLFGAVVSGAMTLGQRPGTRAEAAGRGTAVLIFVLAGVVLIALHFLRRLRGHGPRRGAGKRG